MNSVDEEYFKYKREKGWLGESHVEMYDLKRMRMKWAAR